MSRRRRVTIVLSAAFLLLSALLLGSLNAFNPHLLTPHTPGQIFVFTALSAVIFLLLVFLLVLLSRNILKLFADQQSRGIGSRIRTRLLTGALLLSAAPVLFMFLFSYLLMNRSIDRWFTQPVAQLRDRSVSVALELSQYVAGNARDEAASLAAAPALDGDPQPAEGAAIAHELQRRPLAQAGGFALVFPRNGTPLKTGPGDSLRGEDELVAQYQVPPANGPVLLKPWMDDREVEPLTRGGSLPAFLLAAARRSDQPVVSIGGVDYMLGAATSRSGRIVVVGLPMPAGLDASVSSIRQGARNYWVLFRARNRIRGMFLLLLLLLTALTLFASSWLALHLAKQVTGPMEALAGAMDEIAAGHYSRRVQLAATDEMRSLIGSFNAMAADLEASRALVESSTAQLSEANLALEGRRRELETILETIPTGVVTLSPQLRILRANPAFLDLMEQLRGGAHLTQTALQTANLEAIFPPECADELHRLARRSQRMGIAAGELDYPARGRASQLSATVALLHLDPEQRGYVLVLEDVTESLHAQRQMAWKEVAQRIAHEIKNPLTPISLSAERIRKHIDRPSGDSTAVIRKCSEVILGSVETLRSLVGQFASLAEFPSSSPRPVDIASLIAGAMLPFAGRLKDIQIEQFIERGLPQAMADPEALGRALANLIDNAAEAMQGSLLRRLTILADWNSSRTMAEIVVADTGCGITREMRERLFLPYFSTKQRGTGLGLAIAAKIVQEHRGTIRAEQNLPVGARFVIELPFAEQSGESAAEPDQPGADQVLQQKGATLLG